MNARHYVLGVILVTLGLSIVAAANVGLANVALTNAPAQDVQKVSPETHKVLLDNEHARVFDVRLKPGEVVGMHSHPASILYYLTDGRLKITYPDGRGEQRTVKAGSAIWSDAVTHAVENVGSDELHEVHTELKQAQR